MSRKVNYLFMCRFIARVSVWGSGRVRRILLLLSLASHASFWSPNASRRSFGCIRGAVHVARWKLGARRGERASFLRFSRKRASYTTRLGDSVYRCSWFSYLSAPGSLSPLWGGSRGFLVFLGGGFLGKEFFWSRPRVGEKV